MTRYVMLLECDGMPYSLLMATPPDDFRRAHDTPHFCDKNNCSGRYGWVTPRGSVAYAPTGELVEAHVDAADYSDVHGRPGFRLSRCADNMFACVDGKWRSVAAPPAVVSILKKLELA